MSEKFFDLEIFLLYFAHRHLSRTADDVLLPLKMGRAHHRLMFFVGRMPGASVNEMLELLQVTNQSLHRVMTELIAAGFLEQKADGDDRRQRRLFLTREGAALERRCAAAQADVLRNAASKVGASSARNFSKMLEALMTSEDHELYAPLIKSRSAPRGSRVPKR